MLRRSWSLVATAFVVCGVACACAPADAEEFSAEQLEFFETKVRPLLAENCYACHSGKAGVAKGGVRLDHRQTLLEGGDSGPAVAPGDPDASLLLEAVRYESFQMPPSGKLPEQDIQTLARWVEMGAPWPDEPLPEVNGGEEVFDLQARRDEHWAWRPIASPTPPAVADASWPADPLDQFILARLEAESLRPASPKSRTALLRRLSFDLTGLPPTPEEVREFLADESPEATAKLVDRLLASPRFGERWGRHWLDLVRYAESRGHEYDYDAPNAYQYRDYAIRAFNQDVPYDQFLREHLAGDLMESPRLNPEKGFNESILGTGFWHLGEWVHSPVDTRKDEADRFDNMLDVMSKSMLAMTVSCARCHDHKFDAISSVDYHALSGFLQSSDFRQARFESMTHNQAVARRLAELDARYQAQVRRLLAAADAELPTVISGGEQAAGPTTPPCPVSARVLIDFATLPPVEFRQDGFAFGDGVRRVGEPCLAYTDGKPTLGLPSHTGAAFDPFWRDLENVSQAFVNTPGQLDPAVRGGRTLRTPTVQLATGDVHLLVRGGGQAYACVDTHRTLAGPLHLDVLVRSPASDLPDQPRWVAMKLQRYAGARVHFEFTPDEHNQLEVLRVVERAVVDAPSPVELAESREPPTLAGNEAEALRRWRDGETLPEPVATALASRLRRVLESPSEYLSLDKAREVEAVAAEWAEQRERLRGEVMRRSALAMASMDLSGEDDHRLIRGNTATPAEVVPRRFLEAIDGPEPMEIPRGSGRMQLAERVVDPANPLTSRVIVNRVWHHLLGVGIVPTPDNFGVLGKEPTHPELLDYLATEFVRDGQSIKRLIRRVALSSTYAMSSAADPDAIAADPQNLLWSHVPPKRLEAEPIRDTLLLLSGRLDERMYGQSTPLHLTSFMQGRGRPKQSGPLDGDGRRSIYLEVRRNFLSPMALAFDLPSPFSCMGRRTRSNVPAQALMLLNSPFVAEQTRLWAGRALAPPAASAEDRVDYLYRSGLGRDPTQEERAAVVQFVRSESAAQGVPPDAPSLWADAAHALVNAKEFIYLP